MIHLKLIISNELAPPPVDLSLESVLKFLQVLSYISCLLLM